MSYRSRNKRYEDNDWFHIIDKQYSTVHTKYDNLEKQKVQITKESFILSLIENVNDKKKYDLIKEQMEKQEIKELDNIKNKSYDVNRNKNGLIYPSINIKNYKEYKPQTKLATTEHETIITLLKKFDNYNNKKLIEQYTHKKIIPKEFKLSGTNYTIKNNFNSLSLSTLETDDYQNHSHRSLKKYEKPNLFFKPSLNNILFNVLQKANNEEEKSEKYSIDIIQNLKKSQINLLSNKKKNNINNNITYNTDINVKKTKPKIIDKNSMVQTEYNYPIINKVILKGNKKNIFRIAKEKMYDVYLKNKKAEPGKKIKLISSRRNSDDDENTKRKIKKIIKEK